MRMKRRLSALLAALLLFAQMCTFAEGALPVAEVSKYGNLVLDISGEEFFELGYDYGDIISVEISRERWIMPVGSSYSDVEAGEAVCRVESMEEAVVLAINMGNLAEEAGVSGDAPGAVSICPEEAAGYRDEWLLRQLTRTNERGDYARLSDAAFANFRAVDTSGMGEGMLYRSSSPVNPELGRSGYAVAAMEAAGVRTVINLADAEIDYPGWEDSYYAGCAVICLNLGIDPAGAGFREGVAAGLRFMIANDGPYLVHCTEGKDRAGFVSALLECLMGAPAGEVVSDYMESYFNYYGVAPGSEQYEAVAEANILPILAKAFGVEDIFACDLAAEAREYLAEAGLSPEEIDNLVAKLSA